jgi:TrmH family RNA methyltransferase
MFLAEGPRVVADLLDTKIPVHLALYTTASAGDPAVAEVIERLRASDIPIDEVSSSEFEEFAGTVTPQGILAMADIPAWSLSDVERPRLTVLDAVQDPGNVGTLIRTAEALGAGGVCLLPGTADPWSPKTVRAAAGSSFRLPVVEVGLPELRSWCDTSGAALLASATGGEPAERAAADEAVALVLGNEGAGVSAAVLEAADGVVGIPLLGSADSLNVAIAGAILMDRMFGG